MPELPTVSGKDVLRVFLSAGWTIRRVNGSHHIMVKSGYEPFPLPVHGNCDIKRGTLRAIIKSAGMTVDEFVQLLKHI